MVKTAPTGKVALNIKGNTPHAAFKIPANRGLEYCALDSDRLNTVTKAFLLIKFLWLRKWYVQLFEFTTAANNENQGAIW